MARSKALAPGRGTGSLLWLQGLICGALLTFATPTALLIGVLMAPAVASWIADTQPGRPMARAVAVAALAPSIGPVWHLWLGGDSMANSLAILSDPPAIGIAWGAAACGWAMCQVLPVILRTIWEMREGARAKALAEELEAHKREWDAD